jgi:hypothetical protein
MSPKRAVIYISRGQDESCSVDRETQLRVCKDRIAKQNLALSKEHVREEDGPSHKTLSQVFLDALDVQRPFDFLIVHCTMCISASSVEVLRWMHRFSEVGITVHFAAEQIDDSDGMHGADGPLRAIAATALEFDNWYRRLSAGLEARVDSLAKSLTEGMSRMSGDGTAAQLERSLKVPTIRITDIPRLYPRGAPGVAGAYYEWHVYIRRMISEGRSAASAGRTSLRDQIYDQLQAKSIQHKQAYDYVEGKSRKVYARIAANIILRPYFPDHRNATLNRYASGNIGGVVRE